jgi:arginine metabolism regulation protein II
MSPESKVQDLAHSPTERRNPEDRINTELSWLNISESSPNDRTACEFIYGVPQSLFVLMRKATAAIRLHLEPNHPNAPPDMSGSWTATCDAIEAEILHWPLESELSKKANLFHGTHAELIRHQTLAFHHALVIFFAQHYRRLPGGYLRSNVEAIIASLEAIEELKLNAGALCGPIFWPAFIAASEALDQDLQRRFLKCFDNIQMYGLNSVTDARDLVVELWKDTEKNNRGHTSRWRALAEAKRISLMLT